MSYVFLGKVEPLEPVMVTGRYGRGAFYRALDYIPSSTLAGAVVSAMKSGKSRPQNLDELREELKELSLWFSHAYPIDEVPRLSIYDPLPLPVATLAKKDGAYVSTALSAAELKRTGNLDVARVFHNLDPKVGRVFAYASGGKVFVVRPYPKEVYTRVCLDLKKRAAFKSEEGDGGLLFTMEFIDVGEEAPGFAFKGVVGEDVLEFLEGEPEVRVGSKRAQGFGLVRISVVEKMRIGEYVARRTEALKDSLSGGSLTVDVMTHLADEGKVRRCGVVLYRRVRRTNFKTWLVNGFVVYRGVVQPGGVYVLEAGLKPEELARVEVGPPDDPVARLHGLNMLFFNNPVHFVKV